MGVAIAALVTLLLVGATVLIHYEVLGNIHRLLPHVSLLARRKILLVIGGILFAHLVEICLFALAFYLMHQHFGLGSLAGEFGGGWLDFFYFSASTYTTLGVGDVVPLGPLRVVAGIESLNGLVLIGWSTSFTYLTIRDTWDPPDGSTLSA